MESLHERHILDINQMMRLARAVDVLISFGVSYTRSVHYVAQANGMTPGDVRELTKLTQTTQVMFYSTVLLMKQ